MLLGVKIEDLFILKANVMLIFEASGLKEFLMRTYNGSLMLKKTNPDHSFEFLQVKIFEKCNRIWRIIVSWMEF